MEQKREQKPALIKSKKPAMSVWVRFKLNDIPLELEVDSNITLLNVTYNKPDHSPAIQSCHNGECNACTVLCGNKKILSCLTLVATCEGKDIKTMKPEDEADSAEDDGRLAS